MKKCFWIIMLCLSVNSVVAQLNFYGPSGDVEKEFIIRNFCRASTSEVYLVGGRYDELIYKWFPKIYKSTDDGLNWSVLASSIANLELYVGICYTGSRFLLAAQNTQSPCAIYSSIDGGGTWTNSSTGLFSNFYPMDLLSISPTQVYATGYALGQPVLPSLYSSSDGGQTWTLVVVSGIANDQTDFNAICYTGSSLLMATHDAGYINNKIYSSTDGGTTWTSASYGIPPDFYISDLDVVSPAKIYAVGSTHNNNGSYTPGIYVTTDLGTTWSMQTYSYLNEHQFMLQAVCHSGNNIIVGAQKFTPSTVGGVYLTDPAIVTALPSVEEDPYVSFYPSPADNELQIVFNHHLPQVNLELTDLNGKTILKRNYSEVNKLNVDISSVDKGIYFVKLQYGAETLTKKFVKE